MTRTYRTFNSWRDLQAHIQACYPIWYQAPLDAQPALVGCKVRRDGKVRVIPVYTDADPFTADEGHLYRFRAEVQR